MINFCLIRDILIFEMFMVATVVRLLLAYLNQTILHPHIKDSTMKFARFNTIILVKSN